ncbi:MAG: hypothetical protein ABR910_09620 [Acidobacteriaceae bacterium]
MEISGSPRESSVTPPQTIPASLPAAIAQTTDPPLAPSAPTAWTPLARVSFRIAFVYFFFFLFCFDNGTLFGMIPRLGEWIDDGLTWPMNHLAVWVGQHVFHLTGIAARWHPTGSGDTTLNWILNGLFLLFAVTGGLLWSAVAARRGNRRAEYRTLHAWLRFLLRFTIAMFMFEYGLAKLFPLQMAPISIAILNEPVGHVSPMTFLWSLIALNPAYESILGLAEVVGGVLLLFRRTALLGALFSSFVLANVVLDNFFFDVPVKLFATALLLASLFLVLPDLSALFRFFWLRQPAVPNGVWAPPTSRRAFRITIRTFEIIFLVFFLALAPFGMFMGWKQRRNEAHISSPLLGAWHLDPAHPASGPFITPEGLPATDLYLDTVVRAFTRSSDGTLWRTYPRIDAGAHTIAVFIPASSNEVTYSWQMPDPDHIILTSLPPEAPKPGPKAKLQPGAKPDRPFTPAILTFTRTPTPPQYPLLDRGFHFINQWGLER